MSNIEITLPTSVFKPILAQNIALASNSRLKQLDASEITIPGALVRLAKGCMRGHGTYLEDENLMSSVAGQIEKVNQLIRVNPIKMRYQGEIGDVVLGRIIEVQQKRWKVETNSRLHSALLLTSVNLPGGELRRKCIDDELAMREYLKEGDLVSFFTLTKNYFYTLKKLSSLSLNKRQFLQIIQDLKSEIKFAANLNTNKLFLTR